MPWVTPPAPVHPLSARVLLLPDGPFFWGAAHGALLPLTRAYNWDSALPDGITPDAAAAQFDSALQWFLKGDQMTIHTYNAALPASPGTYPGTVALSLGGVVDSTPGLFDYTANPVYIEANAHIGLSLYACIVLQRVLAPTRVKLHIVAGGVIVAQAETYLHDANPQQSLSAFARITAGLGERIRLDVYRAEPVNLITYADTPQFTVMAC